MSSAAITTVVKMMESLPVEVQDRVAEHLREYIDNLQDENQWHESFQRTQQKLVAAAKRAKQEIAQGRDTPQDEDWQYLVTRSHPWRRQLYIKGRKLLASTVWQDTIANEMSPEQAAENWDLPLRAISEVIRYCERHRELLKLEADEERYRLEEKGVSLEPTIAP